MAMRRTVRIALRIDRVVLDAGVAAGRSPAEITELLAAALRDRLTSYDARAWPGAATDSTVTTVDRLRATAGARGVDAIARAAAAAVGEMTQDARVPRQDSRTGSAARGGEPR
ncbi:hypothetical protein ACFYWX_01325 [Streptomyces sp. NPDC002888]|uniref:hypothetical protein n=1 Tax=Streptomyces sp. NPDC002888 TaxID=3364668 RepID=UPI0036CAB06D